ncbi:hypothetical protein Nepgr_000180 [Nepenthes gracilis]|uniref:RING-type domain-containing protein n=1 Tax=Nepenthes gracilis TaxID=150966 RepID=A0AAD3RW75_NEPGR|nr:hypothetical protein Nepgr_000180 [Nepenthes gracilis]
MGKGHVAFCVVRVKGIGWESVDSSYRNCDGASILNLGFRSPNSTCSAQTFDTWKNKAIIELSLLLHHHHLLSAVSTDDAGPSTSSEPAVSENHHDSEAAELLALHENRDQPPNSRYSHHRHSHSHSHRHRHHTREQQPDNASYRFNISVSNLVPSDMRDDVWSCLVVLVTFWFFASMTLILGFYGSVNLQLGPNYSHLITANPLFAQSIKAQVIEDQISGPMLYGFHKSPPLDVETTWSETHSASIQSNFHTEWTYYLNTGSKLDISYDVKFPSYASLSFVVAEGRESLVEWLEDPSYPNTTLSWNIISGSGMIEQEIKKPATYFIAVGNLNSEAVKVQLNFSIMAILYNTTKAYFKCSLSKHICSVNLFLLKENAALLTSPDPGQAKADDDWYVKVSYGPRWVTYIIGSGIMIILILLIFRVCSVLQSREGGYGAGETGQEAQDPLLSPKDDDLSNWGSSYDSVSPDEDLDESAQEEGKPREEADQRNTDSRRLCVICFDAPRDCFFLPCGHCAACFTCGSKIAEGAGTCPICRRKMKKVRKIFSV